MQSRIPQRLHFLWGLLGSTSDLSEEARETLERWEALHPGWPVRVHDAKDSAALAARFAGQPYEEYAHDIQRCDVARPMRLHREGGVYADLDVWPRATIGPLLEEHAHAGVLLVVEKTLPFTQAIRIGLREPIRRGKPERRRRLANYFMASVPGHPFWLDVLALAKARAQRAVRRPYDVLYTTGPDLITEVAAKRRYADVAVLSERAAKAFIEHGQAGAWRALPGKRAPATPQTN